MPTNRLILPDYFPDAEKLITTKQTSFQGVVKVHRLLIFNDFNNTVNIVSSELDE